MSKDKEKIIDQFEERGNPQKTSAKDVKDTAEKRRHPVLAVRSLLPSIINEDEERGWSMEAIIGTAAVIIVVAALITLYIYGATVVA